MAVVLRAIGLLLLLFGMLGSAVAQQVVEEGGPPNPVARLIRGVADQKLGGFPAISAANPDGAVLLVSGDFFNSDASLYVANERLDELKPKILDLLRRLNLPRTVLRVRRGRKVGELDMEFNRYMSIRGNHSQGLVPIGMIVDTMKTWNLPQPFGIAIEGSPYKKVLFEGEHIETVKLLWPEEVRHDDQVEVTVDRHWYGLVILCLMGGVLASGFIFLIKAIFLVGKTVKKQPDTPIAPPVAPTTLGEAQALYDKRSKPSISRFISLFPFVVLFLVSVGRPWMHDVENWLDPGKVEFLPLLPLIFVIPLGAVMTVRRLRRGPSTSARQQDLGPLRYLPWMMLPMLVMMSILVIQRTWPKLLYAIPTPALLWVIRVIGFGPLVAIAVVFFLAARKSTLVLKPGDPDYDAAYDLAKKAGVKLRKVVVMKNAKSANAFANLFGTIGLTQGARERLTIEERRAVIAHELGHIKGRHVPGLVLFSLGIWFGIAGLEIWIQNSKLPPAVTMVATILTSPIVFIPLLIFSRSPLQRKAEYSADKFALEQIGSFTEVATALAKIHLLNASPHTFTKFHESIASHPSLIKRLTALRTVALQLGMDVPPDEIDKIISTLTVEPATTTSDESIG